MKAIIKSCVLSALLVCATTLSAQDPKPQDKLPAAPTVTTPFVGNATCPIMGNPTKPELSVATDKGAVYMCCKGCTAKILKDTAAAYAKAYPKTEKLGNKICPVTGEAIKPGEGKAVVYKGREIMICCGDCEKPLLANGDVIVTLLTNPKVVDIKNTKDPVSDKPVVDNTFVLIGDDLVHLSSKDGVDEIKKDPAKYLKKAKETAAKPVKDVEGGDAKHPG